MINIKLPVRLKKHAHFKGNFYHPRIYQPGELPLELMSEDLVTQEESSSPVSSFTRNAGAFLDTEIKLTVEEPSSKQVTYNNTEVAIVKPKLSINKATVTELTGVGIPMNAAKKIVELREKEKFADINSLEPVTLPKGKNWSAFEPQLVFE